MDLKRRVVTAKRTLNRSRDGLIVQEPKTERSRRSVAISHTVASELQAHRRRQVEERMFYGEAYHESDLVFTATQGGPLDPRNLTRHFVAH